MTLSHGNSDDQTSYSVSSVTHKWETPKALIFTPIPDAFLQKSRTYLLLFRRRVNHSLAVDAFPLGTRISNSQVYVKNSIVTFIQL